MSLYTMMAYNILYARDDNGLSLQQGAGWDCNPTISGELGRENDSQEAERYPRRVSKSKIPGAETSGRTEELQEPQTTKNFLEKSCN